MSPPLISRRRVEVVLSSCKQFAMRSLWVAASQAAEKVSRFVGRAFRHDMNPCLLQGF